jgi:hypothetical protein
MRPLAALIGIITGSAVSLAVGLTLTWMVLLFLPEHSDRFAGERGPLLQAMALFALTAAVSGASFYAELRARSWRYAIHAATLFVLALTIWVYWPRR